MNNANIEKFTKQIIDDMYKYYNFIIEDFSNIEGLSISWGLSRRLEDGTKEIIVFLNIANNDLNEVVEDEICIKTQCIKENLIKVILKDSDMDSNLAQNNLLDLNNDNSEQNNFILLDLSKRSLQISSNSVETIARQIASIINNNTNVKSNKKGTLITYSLITINILIFVLSSVLSGSFMDININVLVNLGAKYNLAIENGQWYRLFTCMFLHGGLIHISVNMYSLYSIGPIVERLYGKGKFIFTYLAAGVISSLFSFWFSDSVSIGASGAIFGLLGVLFVFAFKERNRLGKNFFINIASTVALNLYIGLTLPGIDNYGHLGGLIGGIVLGSIIKRSNN